MVFTVAEVLYSFVEWGAVSPLQPLAPVDAGAFPRSPDKEQQMSDQRNPGQPAPDPVEDDTDDDTEEEAEPAPA